MTPAAAIRVRDAIAADLARAWRDARLAMFRVNLHLARHLEADPPPPPGDPAVAALELALDVAIDRCLDAEAPLRLALSTTGEPVSLPGGECRLDADGEVQFRPDKARTR